MKTPHELAEERMGLSEQYSAYSGELAKLTRSEAEFYIANRKEYKSDTAVARAFEVTDDGVKMTTVKLKLKALEKQMSAIKTMIDVATEEARGLY
jgi:hypothetical protein